MAFAKSIERRLSDFPGRSSDLESTARIVFPVLLTVDEVADLLQTTRRAIYVMIERHQLPGLTRIGRRVLFRGDDLLDWLEPRDAPRTLVRLFPGPIPIFCKINHLAKRASQCVEPAN